MPSTTLNSEFTSAKNYLVSPFTGVEWSYPERALTSNPPAAATSGGAPNVRTELLGLRGLAGYAEIPDSATISGIEIVIGMQSVNGSGGGSVTGYFNLVKATDSRVGTEKTQAMTIGSGGSYTIGASNDFWGTTWTVAEIKNSEFGVDVGFNYTSGNYSVGVEIVYATIYYTYFDSTARRGVYSTVATLRTN
jgi:hypothetical protein